MRTFSIGKDMVTWHFGFLLGGVCINTAVLKTSSAMCVPSLRHADAI